MFFHTGEQRWNVRATCDDYMEVWVDGLEIQGLPNRDIFRVSDRFSIPASTNVLAIKCTDDPSNNDAMILVSGDNGISSDATWRCARILDQGWTQPYFHETAGVWQSAVLLGMRTVTGINPAVHAVTSNPTARTIYCRKVF